MPAFAPGETRGLIAPGRGAFVIAIGARAAGLLGLFCVVATGGCAPRDPVAIAKTADVRAGTGVYTWLAEHDPSAIVIVGLDRATTRAVAPDARVSETAAIADGCRRALRTHALLAARLRAATPDRDRADDCGFALFRDAEAMVVAPR